MNAGTALRQNVESDEITVLPGAFDALSARLASDRFDAVFTSGFGLSASTLGLPDLGFLDRTANVDRVGDITKACDAPVLADADTGYGSALNVRKTVEDMIDAGAGGVIIEDQVAPKRCGHMDEKRVVDEDEARTRIRAAADARDERSEDLVIVGRTDAREPRGMDAAVERGRALEEAGADVIFVEAPESRDELERAGTSFDVPTFANMIEGGKTPYLSYDEVQELGFDVVVYPLSALFAYTRAVQDTYAALADDGETSAVDKLSFDEYDDIIGADEYRGVAKEYAETHK
ncbi:MAG: isocitrate lyase/PEP mutase family protein [Halobacteria archaeon]